MPTRRALLTAPLTALLGLALLGSHPAPQRLDRAIEAQRALVDEHPADAGAQNDLANLLELAGDRLGAEQAYQRAIELDPDDPAPRFNYALLLLVIDRRGDALEPLERV
ncbi:MAG TPA: tetratricopeptide repeat protein, partial [Thermoanaerobaculia bacterium]|nr:tetratricopeptide repeat protein [Thermoanaerobaculia bacterium]